MTLKKGYHELTMSKKPHLSHKVPRIMRAKAKKAPMCSVSLIAIELKGLAAPGEALKNMNDIKCCLRSILSY